jgi:CHAT domain-containing protein
MKKIILTLFIIVFSYYNVLIGQEREIYNIFLRYNDSFNSGDFIRAEKTLLQVINPKVNPYGTYFYAAYNNLGVISLILGEYEKALEFNFKAESYLDKKNPKSQDLADIFNNRGNIYTIKKSYDIAVEYLEKSIRIYQSLEIKNKILLNNLSSAYINLSIAFIETKNYSLALDYLEKNVELNLKYNLKGLSLTYLNIAKTYVRTGDSKKADEFYLKSITSFINEFNKDYYRLAEVYFDYGLFLQSEGENLEALDVHKRSLAICLKNYGAKHTLVSLSYKHIADDYLQLNKPDTALFYYQKSLIAVVKDFNNHDIFTNPAIDSSLFDIRLLDNLKSKARAMELFAGRNNDTVIKIKYTAGALETIELALQLIDRIRNNYMSEESRIYLAGNEKETYLFATHLAYELYSKTHDKATGYKMYAIAQKAKAAILRNEISGNELLYSAAVPDSLRERQNRLTANIAAYNNLIIEENRKSVPDSSKIALWKDALFDMNREKEKVTGDIEIVFPQYHDLLRKTEPVPLEQIQKQLKKDETVIDYLISNQYEEGKRELYVFLISGNNLGFRELWLDSLFVRNAEIIRKTVNPAAANASAAYSFIGYTDALNYMYLKLIEPVEGLFKGKKLIIIPDEEIGWLPFDAFLKNKPESTQSDYEGLSYLINDYIFSYGYSSSLIFSKSSSALRKTKVFAFSPDYLNASLNGTKISSLRGAGLEIKSIFKRFIGISYSGENATKTNFINALHDPAILHLAMHSMSDSLNSRYSYLMFDTHNSSTAQGKLFNYEISLARIKSPMVVLSACNSGTGTLYYGEGLMSLARGFTLAGASSVIKTAWEINDEASASIMTRFYFYLSKGKEKNEAMHLAKSDFLKASSPEFKNPYYWAAYEVLGDNAPVALNLKRSILFISLAVLLSAGFVLFYFKYRRIFSERSR